MNDLLQRYTGAALRGDRRLAARVATEMLTGTLTGSEPRGTARVISDLLAPSQREVGQRWLEQRCSVGDEHVATSVTESVLCAMTVGFEPDAHRGRFVMACAEGERHGLAARMAAELLILDGWQVIHLGVATPADELRRYLVSIEADIVGISCTRTPNLPGAARSVAAARGLGVPVVVGGAAFGIDDRRATAVGADAWLPDLTAGFDPDLLPLGNDAPPVDLDGSWVDALDARAEILRDAMRWLQVERSIAAQADPSWMAQIVYELDELLAVTAAAALCEDPSIVAEHRSWLARLCASDNELRVLGDHAFDAISAVIGDHAASSARMIGIAGA